MTVLTAFRDWSSQTWDMSPEKRNGFQEVVKKTWFLGLTSFGGTAVQFRMVCALKISPRDLLTILASRRIC